VGIMLISGAAKSGGWGQILNGPVLAILSAAGLHFAGAARWMPTVVLTAVHNMGVTAIPLGLILSGAIFADQAPALSAQGSAMSTAGACVLRLGALPLLMLALARWLPCPAELRHVMIVQAAMPCALFPVMLSKLYGGDPAESLRIVLATSVLGLLTIPFWIGCGLRWVG